MDGALDEKPRTENWGLLEPLRIFAPAVDIIKPLLTGNILYGLLVGLLVASWFQFGFSGNRGGSKDLRMGFFSSPERLAAYEEIWRREESELWDWLEERVGREHLRDVGKMPIEAKKVEDRLKEERMDEREVEDAIRVTEERLKVLKDVVEKKKKKEKEKKTGDNIKAPGDESRASAVAPVRA